MPQSLESYIKKEWSDYPISLIGHSCGESYAIWLIENLYDEYQDIVTDEAIREAQTELVTTKLMGVQREIQTAEIHLKALVASIFQDHLKIEIEDYRNSIDVDEENRLESISFDNQRAM
jgi:hypothetical protein